MHSFKHFSLLLTGFLMSVLLSACGSKGDLYQIVEPEPEQSIMIKESQKKNNDTKQLP
jgi:hypothetical protein